MKKLIIILTLFIIFINISVAVPSKVVTKDYKTIANDGFSIHSTLCYPNEKSKKEFYTVVLLHSLGYSSDWWGNLPDELLKHGFAVLKIDLRGHGKSIYSSRLNKVSWKNMTNKAYSKYPDDVLAVIEYVKKENKRNFFNNWAIVGSDIGAATGIIVTNKIKNKPKTIVMLSPVIHAKGLYVPVNLAELNNIDTLSVVGAQDINGIKANEYLKRFTQSTYAEYSSDSVSSGLLMLKRDGTLSQVITSWIEQYLK